MLSVIIVEDEIPVAERLKVLLKDSSCIFPNVWIKTYYAHKNQTEQEIEPTLSAMTL